MSVNAIIANHFARGIGMFLKSIKSALVLSFLLVTTVSYGQINSAQKQRCPSLETLHQYAASIEVGQIDLDGSYNAYSLPIIDTEKGYFWMVFVNYMTATSDEEAIRIGQATVQNATIQSNQFPYKLALMNSEIYICGYGDNIFLFGGKNEENASFPLSVRKMNKLLKS